MNLHRTVFHSGFRKIALASVALGGFLLIGVPGAKADSSDDCNRRVSYTEMRYHEAVERFGPYSGAARHWAHERQEAFARREHFRRGHDRDDRYYRDYDRR
jgi:hypothetical protein